MIFKRYISLLAALCFTLAPLCGAVRAKGEETYVFHADSLNGTRWADTLVVYRGIARDGQNEWGDNVLVDSTGLIIGKIPRGDAAGKNLAVPEGGMIVSGTGDIGKEVYECAQIGGKVFFDEYSMNVYICEDEPDPYYSRTVRATHFNGVRYAGRLVIYDRSGESTGTNTYGYEVCVSKDGTVISAGGNDNVVPQGGYVISAIEGADKTLLKTYFQVGAVCTRSGLNIQVTYDRSCLGATLQAEIALLKAEIEKAKAQLRLVDYDSVTRRCEELNIENPQDIPQRNALIAEIRSLFNELIENSAVQVRAVWYRATENKASDIASEVAEMAECGVNELVLDATVSGGSLASLPEGSPFRAASVTKRLDVINEYIARCREHGIRVTLLVPVMSNHLVANGKHAEWYSLRSDGQTGDEIFYSPANAEYRAAFTEYIRHIVTNYDIDGLQLDYIRYPYSDGSVDFGYDDATVTAFCEQVGATRAEVEELRAQLASHSLWNKWQEFKCGLINGWVEEIYGICSELRPDIAVSAAVAATGGKRSYCQDSTLWVTEGYIDSLYVMSYAEGVNDQSTAAFTPAFAESGCLVMGCGAYLSLTDNDVISDTSSSMLCGADGIAYFEWSAYKAHGFAHMLHETLFANGALHFFGDPAEVRSALISRAKERFALAGSDAAEALTFESGVDEIRAVMEKVKGESNYEYLTRDLSCAVRVINGAKAPHITVGPEPSGEEPSAEESPAEPVSGGSSVTSSETSAPGESSSVGGIALAIGIVCAAAICAAAAVIVLRKKKK